MKKNLAICLLLLASSSAVAVDGVIGISQACVSTGCLAGDAPGFPVTINFAGSYRLTSNLFNANTDITTITINANAVTLDLNGFRVGGINVCSFVTSLGGAVSCTNSGTGIGIDINSNSVVVENGHIMSIGSDCISTDDTINVSLSNLSIEQCGSNGISSLSGSQIDNVRIRLSNANGILAGFSATQVSNSYINGNGQSGQLGGSCSNTTFTFNNSDTICTPLSPNFCAADSSC